MPFKALKGKGYVSCGPGLRDTNLIGTQQGEDEEAGPNVLLQVDRTAPQPPKTKKAPDFLILRHSLHFLVLGRAWKEDL